jgi:hypothetical protein
LPEEQGSKAYAQASVVVYIAKEEGKKAWEKVSKIVK